MFYTISELYLNVDINFKFDKYYQGVYKLKNVTDYFHIMSNIQQNYNKLILEVYNDYV